MPGRGYYCSCRCPLPVTDAVARVEVFAATGLGAVAGFDNALAPFAAAVALAVHAVLALFAATVVLAVFGPTAVNAVDDVLAVLAPTAVPAVYDVPAVLAPTVPTAAHVTFAELGPPVALAVLAAIVVHAVLAVHGAGSVAVNAAAVGRRASGDKTTRWRRS